MADLEKIADIYIEHQRKLASFYASFRRYYIDVID